MELHAAVAATAMLTATSLPAFAQTAEDAFGVWRHPENGSFVEMYKCGNALCAKITKVTDGQKTDASKRSRPIDGLVIMDAKKSGTASWSGQLYNRADGRTYSGTLTVKSKGTLDLAGCKAVAICKTLTWTRVQ